MTIGIWGDSIAYGRGDGEALGWVGRIRKSLPAEEYHDIYNFSICGNNTFDLLRRFEPEAYGQVFDKVIFAIGTNDAKYSIEQDTNLVTTEDFESNLKKLITSAKQYSKEVILMGATIANENIRHGSGILFINKEIQKYNQLSANIASANNLKFISVYDLLNPELDLADAVHPNTVGYQKMFEYISSKII
ncbi:SGNH/GDSL hydrolase family protein [Candidatus Nomurabacteria bacterium]|nr:SGNH/GDSL hydrolase family protein [Candidatus Kaiserbacteria bacterium]MCB9814916.1 SGNH/GDSL hydrolase family protein [Candidatus Nomurabacteria bacterium]